MSVWLQSVKNIVLVSKKFPVRYLLVLLVALIGFSVSTFAQQTTIVGTVTDPSGAAIPNVVVTVTNVNTGASKTYPTNDSGQYAAVDLNIGHYVVKAEAKGFKVAEQKDIVLTIGARLRVDFQMQLGAAQETVTVEANAVQVQTDSGERSNLITDQQMSQIAVNGRSIYQLAALTPGASSQITGFVNTPVGGDAGVEFNGMRQNHNIYLLDGGEDDDRGGAGGMSIAPSSDAIAEFRALTSNYSADYGLSSAGTMTMVLKSGTSQYHASAWEFNRNDYFDARNYFVANTPLRLNVYGFNVGGPVSFGHFYNPDKKRTFFFYNMEWRPLIQGASVNQLVPGAAVYPTAAGADLSSLNTPIKVPTAAQVAPAVLFANCPGGVAPAGISQAPGSIFPGAVIPSCMINGNAASLLNAGIFPAANGTDLNGNPEFKGGANSSTTLREEVVRIDHNFTSKFSVFGHYIAESVSQGFATSQWSGDNVPTVGDTFGNPSYSAVVHTTYTISPTLINEVAFNYNGNRINIIPYAASGLASLALPTGYDSTASRLFTGPNNMNRIPNIDLSGGAINSQFEISSWPWKNKADDYQVRDDISWTHGAHQFKFGGSWALYKKTQDLFGQTQGGFSFNGTYTGVGYADMLLGTASSYQELAVQDSGQWNNVSWAFYGQDNWRVNRRLTLNLGLRWDGIPHTYEANDRMGNFYPQLYNPANAALMTTNGTICGGAFNPITGANPGCSAASPGLGFSPNPILAGVPLYLNGIGVPGTVGVPKGLVNNHWATFGPRLGFAYDLTGSGKTVIRGGFGIMYERIQGNDMYNAGPNIPFSLQVNSPFVTMTDPSIANVSGAPVTLPINAAGITGLDINDYKPPVSYQWSIGVQHAIGTKTVFTASYVGNVGRHQNDYRNINLPAETSLPGVAGLSGFTPINYNIAPGLPYPGFNSITLSENEANTHYNGLQMDLNSQVGRDLTLRAIYTLSHAVDPTTGGNGGGDLGTVSNPYAGWQYDAGNSGYDRLNVAAVNFIYDIPLMRHSESRLLKAAIGGWQVSGIVTIESGLPVNIVLGGNQGSMGVSGANRPDLTGTLTTPHTVGEWFNPLAFSAPTPGAWGTFPHNDLRGPGRDNWNLSLFKRFTLWEARGSYLELRLETFNTWNHTQFNGIGNTYNGTQLVNGVVTPVGNFGQVTSAFDPRILQLGGKIYF